MGPRTSHDLNEQLQDLNSHVLSRRQLLRFVAGALAVPAIGGLLAACGGDDDDDDTDTATGTSSSGAATTSTGSASPTTSSSAASPTSGGSPAASTATGQLEFFSWWTSGGEAAGLNAMYEIYTAQNPGVEIINAAVAGGAGTNAKAVLATRLTGGEPPDSFQLHAGLEVEKYAPDEYLEPIDDLFTSEGWDTVFPQGLLDLLRYEDHYWSVPVNIHRANVLWYNKTLFTDNSLDVPATFDDFFAACDTLKAAGVIPFAMGTKEGFEAGHVVETVLLGTLGADGYRGLWTGETDWTGAEVGDALDTFTRMMEFANEDHSALTWSEAADLIIAGDAAMMIMGDWTAGQFGAKNFTDYGWAPTPGTDGVFDALSDTFALPKNAPDRDNAIAWLKVAGSLAGQEAFNPEKGSICARTDCGDAAFAAFPATHEYLTSAAEDWTSNEIVPSVAHGAAAKESWVTEYQNAIIAFLASGDVEGTQEALQSACVNAEVCS
jgi:glucose/mannose transport system substrate-binding protein